MRRLKNGLRSFCGVRSVCQEFFGKWRIYGAVFFPAHGTCFSAGRFFNSLKRFLRRFRGCTENLGSVPLNYGPRKSCGARSTLQEFIISLRFPPPCGRPLRAARRSRRRGSRTRRRSWRAFAACRAVQRRFQGNRARAAAHRRERDCAGFPARGSCSRQENRTLLPRAQRRR